MARNASSFCTHRLHCHIVYLEQVGGPWGTFSLCRLPLPASFCVPVTVLTSSLKTKLSRGISCHKKNHKIHLFSGLSSCEITAFSSAEAVSVDHLMGFGSPSRDCGKATAVVEPPRAPGLAMVRSRAALRAAPVPVLHLNKWRSLPYHPSPFWF